MQKNLGILPDWQKFGCIALYGTSKGNICSTMQTSSCRFCPYYLYN